MNLNKKGRDMQWLFGSQGCSEGEIKNLESKLSVKFPKEFLEIIKENDGAYPEKNVYNLKNKHEKVVQCLLSCKDTQDGILYAKNIVNIQEIIPFMRDPFGNFVCFRYQNQTVYDIVLWDHEDNSIYPIANSFMEFVDRLFTI